METKDEADEALLELAQHNIFKRLLPVIVLMTVLGAAGIVGNIFAFIYYAYKSKQSSTVRLIVYLALADLIVCVLSIPNIIEMTMYVRNTLSILCKVKHFLTYWAISCSCLILLVIAFDRYRKICAPFGKQITMSAVKYVVIGIYVFGFFFGLRNLVHFDTVEINVHVDEKNKSVVGHYCTSQNDEGYAVSITIFTVIDFLLVLVVWITLVIVYSRIIFTLHKIKRTKQRKAENTHTLHTVKRTKQCKAENPQMKGLDMSNQACEAHATTHSLSKTVRLEENTSDTGVVCTELSQPGLRSTGESEASLNAYAESNMARQENGDQCGENSHYSGSTLEHMDETKHEYIGQSSVSHGSASETSTDEPDSITRSNDKIDIPAELSSTQNLEKPAEGAVSPEAHHDKHQNTDTKRRKQKTRNTAKSSVERILTFKMLVVSLVFIICFTPYFAVKILIRLVLKYGEEYELGVGTQFALRLPYMNSVLNPVVYCVFNPQFRRYIRNVSWGAVLRCCNKTKNIMRS